MKKSFLAVCFCLAWAVSCYAQTAIRPDQICPGGACATPDITWGPGGGGYQIGSTVTWRTSTSSAPTFTSADRATFVELTAAPTITASLPDTTVGGNNMGDGFGFTIQVATGTLTLNRTGTTNKINGLNSITVGPYQAVTLVSRSGQWYGNLSVPQPSTQTGANVLADNMIWVVH